MTDNKQIIQNMIESLNDSAQDEYHYEDVIKGQVEALESLLKENAELEIDRDRYKFSYEYKCEVVELTSKLFCKEVEKNLDLQQQNSHLKSELNKLKEGIKKGNAI